MEAGQQGSRQAALETTPEDEGKGRRRDYHTFVERTVDDVVGLAQEGKIGPGVVVWVPLGVYAASSNGSALGHHFELAGLQPELGDRFHAVPDRNAGRLRMRPPERPLFEDDPGPVEE